MVGATAQVTRGGPGAAPGREAGAGAAPSREVGAGAAGTCDSNFWFTKKEKADTIYIYIYMSFATVCIINVSHLFD
jgi:hypothetical protein